MDRAAISQVRRFNRIVTQRVGALNDRFLARNRPLGEARLLWEIGVQGRDVRSLRTQLELDSGYVSRLLRSLEAAGLVVVGSKDSDRRVRVARLTRSGLSERAVLDQRSDWADHKPARSAESKFIAAYGFAEFGKWHLGEDDEEAEGQEEDHEAQNHDDDHVEDAGSTCDLQHPWSFRSSYAFHRGKVRGLRFVAPAVLPPVS